MELRLQALQQQLVDLGYHYTLKADSVLLVEKLVADLIETTDNLKKYMRIAQEALQEQEALKFGAEPYKCDNAKLTQQCNELHLSIIHLKENHAKESRELKKSVCQLSRDNEELVTSNKKQRGKIRELELEAARKSKVFHSQAPKSALKVTAKKSKDFESVLAMTDQRVSHLTKEISKLKQQQLDLCAINDELKSKLTHREKEIARLNRAFEGGRSLEMLNKECCYQDIQRDILQKHEEIAFLRQTNSEMESKLKDARCKQHDAMKHALNLAERNTQLEKELQDIDQIALTVEQECNVSKKSCDAKMKKMQERLQTALFELQSLEKELAALKVERERIRSELDASNIEKRHLQTILETSEADKKTLLDKLNSFTTIEQDLNKEIDRLVQKTSEQTRSIADLKGQVMVLRSKETNIAQLYTDPDNDRQKRLSTRVKSPTKRGCGQKENKKPGGSKSPSPTRMSARHSARTPHVPENSPQTPSMPADIVEYMERIKSERDFYVREYKLLLEKNRKDGGGSVRASGAYNVNIRNTLENVVNPAGDHCSDHECEKGVFTYDSHIKEQLCQLRAENLNLQKEKHNLLSRLEEVRDYTDGTEYLTMKASSKRVERERDILKTDIERLEDERESLKNRFKVATDLHVSEIDRYKKLLADQEEELRKIDKERYDILQSQGSRRATITNLEDQVDSLKAQLKASNDELIHHKTIYSQLKILHEQTDRALADSQNHLIESESQLAKYEQRHDAYDNKTSSLTKEIEGFKETTERLSRNLIEVEREKDALLLQLDEKTEKIVGLEEEICLLNRTIEGQRKEGADLRQRFTSSIDEQNTKDCQIKCKNNDISQLKRDLEAALRCKENVCQENKRIQDELSMATMENRKVKCELEVAKRQIDDLKMQLQHYCAEVKRIEDMMANKEIERSEMLDQFRNLSQEATALESNNHSLESEASQTKFQLSVALDHAGELELIIAQQKTLIQTYEKQIADLTTQIATLEIQLKHCQFQQDRTTMEMSSLRELCAKLDKQKDELTRKLQDGEMISTRANEELETLRRSTDNANKSLEKELCNNRTIEGILSDTREQLVDQRLVNQELQNQVLTFKSQISEMGQNLTLATERIDMYQEKALDYSKENTKLRREIANNRYTQSQDDPSRRTKVRLLAKDLCSLFDNSANLQEMHPEIRATFQNLYMGNFGNVDAMTSEATTIPSEMLDDGLESEEDDEEAGEDVLMPLPESRVGVVQTTKMGSSSSSSSINVEEFRQQVTQYGKSKALEKVKITKVKVTSCTQTQHKRAP